MRLAAFAAAATLAMVLATWCVLGIAGADAGRTRAAAAALDAFERAENLLHRDILRARSGALRSYDPLVEQLDQMRAALDGLRAWAMADATLAPLCARLGSRLQRTEALTERVKTTNALLQNSLAYFGALSARGAPAEADLDGLAAAVLRLSLDPSATAALDRRLDDASARAEAGDRAALLAHARMLRRLLPVSDGLLRGLSFVMASPEIADLAREIDARQAAFSDRAAWVRQVLYALSLTLAAALFALGLQLRARARTLLLRARLEREIARISTRLITAGRGGALDAELRAGLATLAGCLRADRAWLASDDRRHLVEWGAPAAAPAHARRLVVASENAAFGRAALGFEARRRLRGGNQEALLRLALDALGGAVHRAALEAERERLEASLQRARRAETTGALASGIAHNVNNIVGAILGHSEIAAEHVPPDGRAARSIAEIRRAAARARDLVDQGLAYGRAAAATGVVDLALLIEETRPMLEVSLPAAAALKIRLAGRVVIPGDATQLQQVILNLVANAAQALEGEGAVTLALETRRARTPPASARRSPSGAYAVMAVEDDGRGMDEDPRARIFEPFFTTRAGGVGLGLLTVRAIVEAHGGAVLARSASGRGSRFEVWLPIASAASREVLPGTRGGGEVIAIISDDEPWRMRQEEVIAVLGYEPAGYATLEAAVAALRGGRAFEAALLRLPRGEAPGHATALLRDVMPAAPIMLAAQDVEGLDPASLAKAGVHELVPSDAPAEMARALTRCLAAARTAVS